MAREIKTKNIGDKIEQLLSDKPTGTVLVDEAAMTVWIAGPSPDTSVNVFANPATNFPQVTLTGTYTGSLDLQFAQCTDSRYSSGYTVVASAGAIPSGVTSLTIANTVADNTGFTYYTTGSTPCSISFPDAEYSIGGMNFSGAITALDLPKLITISGDCYIQYVNISNILSFPRLISIDGGFYPEYGTIPAMSFPALTTINGSFNPYQIDGLTSMSFPELATISGQFYLQDLPSLTSVSFGSLAVINVNFSPQNLPSLQYIDDLSFPALTTIGGGDFSGNFNPQNLPSLTSMSFPALTTISARYFGGNFNPQNLPSLTSMSFPALTTIGGDFDITDGWSLQSADFPALETVGGHIQDNTNSNAMDSFTMFNIGTHLKSVGDYVLFTHSALNQTSVDNLLVALANLDGTNGTTRYQYHTVTITGTSSPPSATGLAAKTTLQNRGCTVTTN